MWTDRVQFIHPSFKTLIVLLGEKNRGLPFGGTEIDFPPCWYAKQTKMTNRNALDRVIGQAYGSFNWMVFEFWLKLWERRWRDSSWPGALPANNLLQHQGCYLIRITMSQLLAMLWQNQSGHQAVGCRQDCSGSLHGSPGPSLWTLIWGWKE